MLSFQKNNTKFVILEIGKIEDLSSVKTDFLIKNKNQEPILAIEVKKNTRATKDWAIKLHRNLETHAFVLPVYYFLLVTPNKLFLWKPKQIETNSAEPDLILDSKPIIGRYIDSSGLDISKINEREFESIVSFWLEDILSISNAETFPNWMIKFGLAEAIKDGYYEVETV